MSLYENLPVYKKSLELNIYFEKVVRGFDRYHKYTLGTDLRNLSREILVLVAKANTKTERVNCLKTAIEKLGNLTSQFFANVYMNELDQFAKHTLKAKYYIRYVDDFVILHHDKAQLSIFKEKIDTFLKERLKLTLHPRRQTLRPVSCGIDFLGYIVRQNYTLVRRRVVNNLKEKLRQFNATNKKDLKKMQATIASYLGHFKWANAYRLTDKLILKGG